MFPRELKQLRNWVGYASIERKAPLNPHTGGAGSSTDRATWGTYDEAQTAAKKYGWAGVGVCLEPPYIGIDLDDCVVSGQINDFARDIIRAANTYTEFSPSGTGIHAIGKGQLARPVKKAEIEVYQTGRYFTVTERVVQPVRSLRDLNLAFLDKFYEREIGVARALTKIVVTQDGSRNIDFFNAASSLRGRGCEPQEIYGLLEPKAKEVNFPLEELANMCSRMVRYPAPEAPKIESQGQSVETFLIDEKPVEWICKPFIAEQSIGIIGGLPESRKSWVMVDLAIECARGGGLWLNRFPVKAAKVLLIDQERSKGEVQRRLKAVLAGKGLHASDIKDSLFVRSGTSTRIDQQSSFDALRKEMSDIRPSLVLVDSFATIHTKNESSRFEIQIVMEKLKELRAEFGCAIILIHHETKSSYQNKREGSEPSYLDLSGNVAIPAAAEFCMNICKHDPDSSFCHHTKSTQGVKAAPFLLKVEDVANGGIVVRAY